MGNHFVAYFSATGPNGHIDIGAATSPTIDGQFKDIGHPLVTNSHTGVIDPTFLHDSKSGKQYVYYKIDGNAIGQPSQIMAAQVDAAGTHLIGRTREVMRNNSKSWEGAVVEGPEVVQHGDQYYLFYSGNGYGSDRYAEGVARSDSPTGHFEKKGAPILHSDAQFKGPGHASVVETNKGQDWLVYHAWEAGHVMKAPGRVGLLDAIHWGKDGWPHIKGNSPSERATAPT